MLPGIHPTALVDEGALLGTDVVVGPYAVIGPGVQVGDRSSIGPHAVLERDTTLGADCRVHAGAVLGGDPQDLKFGGEDARVFVGDRTVIREYVTVNRGTMARGRTDVGSDCLLMAYAHVAHDCMIGDRVVIANAVNMGGHVAIGDWAVVGGLTAIHQFVRIGAHAMVGGASAVRKDVPPYQKAAGNPLDLYGLNSVGLQRRGFSEDSRRALKRASRMLFHSKENLRDAVARVRSEVELTAEVAHLLEFLDGTDRGTTL